METSRAELPKRSYLQYLLGKLKHILTKKQKKKQNKDTITQDNTS